MLPLQRILLRRILDSGLKSASNGSCRDTAIICWNKHWRCLVLPDDYSTAANRRKFVTSISLLNTEPIKVSESPLTACA